MSNGAELMARSANAAALTAEMAWLNAVLHTRLAQQFGASGEGERGPPPIPEPPRHTPGDCVLGALIADAGLDVRERLMLALALAPHLNPEMLDPLFAKNTAIDRGFTQFGGRASRSHSGFVPTGETLALLVASDNLADRLSLRSLFTPDHVFQRKGLIRLEHEVPGEPLFSGALVCPDETISYLVSGVHPRPDFSAGFPAQLITTRLDWNDLVLGEEVLSEIETIKGWITHGQAILDNWDLGRVLKPGYRCLFHGPPGTGKTLTATLLGRASNRDVYRIDLSMMVSKYIGETEKNLARVFDRAAHSDWILFFDEADALFGKRTSVSNSNDRYANQEVSYLLQRVEDFPGFVILATNLKANIDEAFARRFQSIVHFAMPDARQRLALWSGVLRQPGRITEEVDLAQLAERYQVSGGAICNIVRFAAINAMRTGREALNSADLSLGTIKELRKEGRTI